MEILNEVGEQWQSFTDFDRSAIATALGGTYQRNTLMAILENWNEVKEAQEVAANSAGSTERKYADYMDSIAAHLNQLSATWSEFLINLEASGTVNTAIDALNGLVKILDFLINKTPFATVVITALTAALIRMAAIKFNSFASNITDIIANITAMKGGKGGIFSSLFSFMGGAGTKGAGQAAQTITAVGNAAKDAGAMAKAGASGFGALWKAISPLAKGIGVISLVIWGFTTLRDILVETPDEIRDSMTEIQENITSAESSIESYNEQLQTNYDRLKEIDELKSKGKATTDNLQEAKNLEKENKLLEEKLNLEKRRLEIEEQQYKKEAQNLFDTEVTNNSAVAGNIRVYGTDIFKSQIEEHNKLVDTAKKKLDDYNESMSNNEPYKKQQKAREEWQNAVEKANESELELMDTIEGVTENYDYLTKSQQKDADTIKELARGIKLANSAYETYGEQQDSLIDSNGEIVDSTESVITKFKELAGTEIKPKDAESMEEWIKSLAETDIQNLEQMLTAAGGSAEVLAGVLSSMSKEDAITYLTALTKNYTGQINNATEATNKFKTALETDYNEDLKNQMQMMDYIQQSRTSGIKNKQAYNAALEGVFGTTNEDLIDFSMLDAYDKFISNGAFDANKFVSALKEVNSAYVDVTGSIKEGNLNVAIKDFSALADSIGMTDTQLSAILKAMSVNGDFAITGTVSALDKQFQKLSESIKNSESLTQGLGTLDIKYFDVFQNNIDAGNYEEQLSNLKSELQTYVSDFNKLFSESIGFKLDFDFENASPQELINLYNDVSTYVNKLKEVFDTDTNTFNFDKMLSEIEELDGVSVNLDEDTITIEEDGATDKVKEQIESIITGGIENVELKDSLLSNFFENVDISGIGEEATEIAENLVNGVNTSLSQSSLAMSTAMSETNEQLGVTIEKSEETTQGVEKISTALNELNTNTDLSNVNSEIQGLSTTAIPALALLNSIKSTLSQINGQEVNIKINKTSSGDANGEIVPAFANGTGALGGKPLRKTRSENALVGEEAPELVIDKHGKKRLVGQHGAEYTHLNAGDTVIPANVTRMILNGQMGMHDGGYTTGSMSYSGSGIINIGTVESLYNTGKNITTSSGSSSGNKNSGRGSGSNSSESEDPAEDLIAELQHRLNMEYITERQYAKELTKIWEQYYKGKADFRDKDWQLEEELHDLQKQFIEEDIDALEYKNGILARTFGTEQDQIINLQQMQNLVHQQAEIYRAAGFDDLSPQIRELSEQWWDYYDEINDLNHQMFENMINDSDHFIDILDERLNRIPDFVNDAITDTDTFFNKTKEYADEKILIYEQKVIQYYNQLADIEAERQRLIRAGYDKNKDMIQELESDAEKLKTNIYDAAEEIRQIKLEEIEEDLDYQEELRTAIREYAEEQVEILQEKIDLLDKENEEKEKANELEQLQQNLENAKNNRYKRVYHKDTGYSYKFALKALYRLKDRHI